MEVASPFSSKSHRRGFKSIFAMSNCIWSYRGATGMQSSLYRIYPKARAEKCLSLLLGSFSPTKAAHVIFLLQSLQRSTTHYVVTVLSTTQGKLFEGVVVGHDPV